MKIGRIILAAALATVMSTSAYADRVVGKVKSYDAEMRKVTLESNEVFVMPKALEVPAFEVGSKVAIDFDGSEDGIDKITKLEVITVQ